MLSALAATGALLWNVHVFKETANRQKESFAVSLLQRYIELAVEYPDLAYPGPSGSIDNRINDKKYTWFASHAVFTAESIYFLLKEDEAWKGTIKGILLNHKPFLHHQIFPCNEYGKDFVLFMQKEIDSNLCTK